MLSCDLVPDPTSEIETRGDLVYNYGKTSHDFDDFSENSTIFLVLQLSLRLSAVGGHSRQGWSRGAGGAALGWPRNAAGAGLAAVRRRWWSRPGTPRVASKKPRTVPPPDHHPRPSPPSHPEKARRRTLTPRSVTDDKRLPKPPVRRATVTVASATNGQHLPTLHVRALPPHAGAAHRNA